MKKNYDIKGKIILLINEREKHIIEEHEEVRLYFERIDDVLKNPDLIKESVYDKEVLLY